MLFTLPDNDGNSGDVLQSNGSGGLSWVSSTAGFGSQTARTVLAAPQGANGAPSFRLLNISDIRSTAAGNGAFLTGAACGAGAGLTYDSVTDTITCTVIIPTVTNASTLAAGKIWVGDGSGKAQAVTISGDASISTDGSLALKNVGTAGTYSKVTTDAQGRVTSGSNLVSADMTTALGYTPVNRAGDTMTGALNMGGYDLTNVGNIELAASKHLLLSQHGSDPSTVGWGSAEKGRTWFNTTANSIKFWNGSAIQTLGIASSGLSSLGGQTGQTQTLAISVDNSVATPTITSASDAHTWKIPMALTPGVMAGLISKTDYDSFNSKLGVSSAFSGDVTGTYDNTSVDKIKGKAVVPVAYAAGQVIRYDGTKWVNTTLDFADLSNKPTTIAGYGITDALSSSLASGKIWVGNASGDATAVTVSGDATVSNAGVLTLDTTGVAAGTYSRVTVDSKGRVTVGANLVSGDITTSLGYTPLNKAGDSMLGTLGLYQTSSDPSTAGWNATQKGFTWFNTTSNEVKYWDGSAIKVLGVAGGGIQSINGQSGNAQTIAVSIDNSVVLPTIAAGSDTITLKVPLASIAGTTAGLVSKAEYDSFNNKLGTTTNFSGDVTGTYDATSVDKLKGKTVTAATAVNQMMIYDGTAWVNRIVSGDATISSTGTLTLDTTGVAAGTYSKVQVDAKGRVLSASQITSTDVTTALGYTPVNRAGDTMAGTLNMGGYDLTNVGNIELAASKHLLLSQHSSDPSTAGWGASEKGRTWFNTSANAIKYWNGSAVQTLGVSSSGLTSLGGQTGQTQTFAYSIDNSVVQPQITSASDVHTIKYPMASNTGTTAGLISKTEYDTFNSKLGAGTAFSGDVTGTYDNTSVEKIKGKAVAPAAYATGQVLRYDGTNWVNTALDFADLSNRPTTLVGYGITDAMSSSLTSGKILVGNASGDATAVTISGDATISNAGILALDTTGVSAGTYTKVTVDSKGRVTGGANIVSGDLTTALGYTPLNKAGDSMLGTLGLFQTSSDPSTAGWNGTQKGFTWFNTTSNEVKYWDGSTIKVLGVSGSGIQSINGQSGNAQTIAVSTDNSVTSPTIAAGSDTITLKIPSASNTGTTAGLISKAEYDIFNAKLGTSSAFSGDVTGTYDTNSVDKIKGKAITAATAVNQIMIYDGTAWVNKVVSGDATITSAGNLALDTTGVAAGTYTKVQVDAKGRVLSASQINSADITTALGYTPPTAALNDGQIFVGNASNVASPVTLSGDATLTNSGVLSLISTGVSTGTYGSATAVPSFTVDSKGRVTVAGSQAYADATAISKGIVQTGANITNASGVISLVSTDVTNALGYTPVNKAGDTMSGALNMGGYDITNVGNIELAASKHLLLSQHGSDPSTVGWGAAEKGRTWFNTTANAIKYWNGSAVQTLGVSSSGLTSLGGQTGQTQTLAISVDNSVATPTITSGSDAHTWKIPMALTPGVTAGLISKTDYDNFNSKLGTSSAFSGDVTGTYDNNSVDKIKGKAVVPGAYAAGQVIRYDGTKWINTTLDFADLSNKPTTIAGYGITDALSSSLASGKILVGNASGDATAVTMSGDATINNAGTLTLDTTGVAAGTYSKVTVDTKGRVTVGANVVSGDITTSLGYTPLNKAGDSMLGTLGLYQASSDPSTAGWNGTQKGFTWFNTTSNEVKYWDGSTIKVLGVAGGGIQSLNGQSGNAQTIAVSTDNSVTLPTIAAGSDTIILKIPFASTAGTAAGLLSKTDYDTFNSKLDTSSSFSGDVTGTYDATSVDKLKGKAIVPAAYASGQVLRYDGTGWVNTALDFADLANKPTTIAGYGITDVMSSSLASGKILVGNASGDATAVTMSGDATLSNAGILTLNTVPVSKGGTSSTSFTADSLVMSNGSGNALTSLTCGLNQLVSFNASGIVGCYNASSVLGGTYFAQGGNSFSADATLGTNDNFKLNFETNGSSRMTIKTDGNVGIGTTNPQYALTLYGASTSMGYVTPGSVAGNQIALNLQTMSNGSDYVGQATAKGWNIYARGNAWATASEQNDLGFSFWNGTTWSTSALLLDSSTGNVGIGTISPGTSLDVSGAITVRPTGTTTGNTGKILFRELAAGGTNSVTLRAPDALSADVSFALPSGDGSSGQVLQTNGAGILSWVTASAGGSGFVDGGNSFAQAGDLGTNDGQPLNLRTNGTTRVVISQDGSMAVNNLLTLNGGLLLNQGTGATDNLFFLRSTSAGAVDASMGFMAAGLGSGSEAHGPYFLARGNSYSASVNQRGNMYFSAGQPTTPNSMEGALVFQTNALERMKIYQDGKIGIGGFAPEVFFDIRNPDGESTRIATAASGGEAIPLKIDNNGAAATGSKTVLRFQATSTNSYKLETATIGSEVTNHTHPTFNADLYLSTTLGNVGYERMRILSSGNVGIGTSAPGTSLDVSGAITSRPFGTSSGNTGQIKLRELLANGTNSLTLRAPDSISADFSLTLPSGDGTSGQVLSTNGSGIMSWVTAAGGGSGFVNGGNAFGANASLGTTDNHSLSFLTNNTTRMTLSPDGDVSIGSSSPTSGQRLTSAITANNGAGSAGYYTALSGEATSNPTGNNDDYLAAITGNVYHNSSNDTGYLTAVSGSARIASGSVYDLVGGEFSAQTSGTGATQNINALYAYAYGRADSVYGARIEATGSPADYVVGIQSNTKVSSGPTTSAKGLESYVNVWGSDPVTEAMGGHFWVQDSSGNVADSYGVFIGQVQGTNHYSLYASDANSSSYFAGKVGIGSGTSAPGTQLDVTGAITSRPYGTATGNTGQILLRELAANGANTVTFRAPDALASDVAFTLPSGDGSSGQVLQTNGSGILSWVTAGGGGGSSFVDGGNSFGTNATLGTNDSRPLAFETNNTTRIAISQDGSVGIGTASPAAFLDVRNGLGAGSYSNSAIFKAHETSYANSGTQISIRDASGETYLRQNSPSGTHTLGGANDFFIMNTASGGGSIHLGTNSKIRMSLNLAGNVGIGTTSPATSLDVTGAITSRPYGTSSGNTGQILMQELAANGTNTVTLRAPDALTSDVAFTLPSADGSNGQVLQTNGSGILSWVTAAGGGGGFVDGGNSFGQTADLGTNDNYPLYFRANNATRMVISQDGSVGIGTTSPDAKLDVVGDSEFTGYITQSGGSIMLADPNSVIKNNSGTAGSNLALIGGASTSGFLALQSTESAGGSDYIKFNVGNNGATEAMRIKTNGYVGIGITNPLSQLHVAGSARSDTAFEIVTGGNWRASMGTGSNAGEFLARNSSANVTVAIRSFGDSYLTGGKFGIGTDTPGTSLDVSGAITVRPNGTATGNTGQILFRELAANGTNTVTLRAPDAITSDIAFTLPSADGGTGQVLQTNGAGALSWVTPAGGSGGFGDGGNSFTQTADLGTNDNYPLYFRTNSVTRVAVSQDGSVGIGTTAPGTSLDVSGAITSRPSGTGTGQTGQILMRELAASGTNTVTLRAPDAITSDLTFTLPSMDGSSGQVLQTSGTGILSWVTPAGGSGGFADGGNSFTQTADLGTNDNYPLYFRTNNTTRMVISQDGSVGIGTSTPAANAKLDVAGQIKSGYLSHSSLNTNWASGNIQSSSVAAGTLTFTSGSMYDGASYVLILTSAGTFTLSTAGDVTTWKCLPACASNQIVATGHTILTIIKAGTTGYVSWGAGYQ
ncbi:MAG: beta strand repeat-containing protein [Pseudobdellovibrionaceae bacterium]